MFITDQPNWPSTSVVKVNSEVQVTQVKEMVINAILKLDDRTTAGHTRAVGSMEFT